MKYYIMDSAGNLVPAESTGNLRPVETITANRTLTVEDSGKTFLVGTDALVITLPATVKGLDYMFINSGAAGNNIITITPQGTGGIAGTITLASSVVTRVGTVGASLVNTKATSTLGNSIRLLGTGVVGTSSYIITSSTGIWA